MPSRSFCDVFCDDGAFTVDEARRILTAAAGHGLAARLHANQLGHSGGAALAAELGAVTADHLDHLTDADIAGLLAAGTVAVLFPTVSLSLRVDPPPARALWDAGVPVAIATDCNPGTSYVENMQFVIAIATLTAGLTPEESLWAATRGGALALRLDDKGWIKPGAVGRSRHAGSRQLSRNPLPTGHGSRADGCQGWGASGFLTAMPLRNSPTSHVPRRGSALWLGLAFWDLGALRR